MAPDLSLRPFNQIDLDSFANYLYHSPPDFIARIGIDARRLPPEAIWRERFGQSVAAAAAGKPVPIVTVLFEGRPIGVHTLTEVKEGESAVFHAHYWDTSMRGKGLGQFSYLLAGRHFFDTFRLKELFFRTPQGNPSPNRVKEKLGIPKVGEGIVGAAIGFENLPANIYCLDRALLDKLLAERGL